MIIKCASTMCNFEKVQHNARFLLCEMEKRQTNKSPMFAHLKIIVKLERKRKYHRIIRFIRNMKTGITTEGTQLGYIDNENNYYDIGLTLKGKTTDAFFNMTQDGYL